MNFEEGKLTFLPRCESHIFIHSVIFVEEAIEVTEKITAFNRKALRALVSKGLREENGKREKIYS